MGVAESHPKAGGRVPLVARSLQQQGAAPRSPQFHRDEAC